MYLQKEHADKKVPGTFNPQEWKAYIPKVRKKEKKILLF